MTDIYIHRSSPKKKWVLGTVLLAVLASIGIWRWARPTPDREVDPSQQSATAEMPPGSPAPEGTREANPSRDLSAELSRLEAAFENGTPLAARESALTLLDDIGDHPARGRLEKMVGDLHTRLVFTSAEMPEKTLHVVRGGDTLGKLAQRYSTTTDLIAEANGIRNNLIRVGAALKILEGEFSAIVRKSRNDLELRLNDRFFKRYRVGTGTDSSTPTGDYVITLRMRHPVWYRPDGRSFAYGHPENLLGTHYLKLNTPGIGLHGTWEPESVGSQSSAGCVRLENEMIEELYKLLPEGTSVRITD